MMESWVRNGRPSLIAALESVCDAIGGDIEAEIRERDERKDASMREEIDQLKAAAARTEVLQQENQSLRQELEELRKRNALPAPSISISRPDIRTPVRHALAEISPNKSIGAWSAKSAATDVESDDLEKRYQNLSRHYKLVALKLDQKSEAGRKLRIERDKWWKYAESLEAKIQRLQAKVGRYEQTLHKLGGAEALDTERETTCEAPETEPQGGAGDATRLEQSAFQASFASNPESGTRSGEDQDEPRRRRAASLSAPNTSYPNVQADQVRTGDASEISGNADTPDELPPIPSKDRGEDDVRIKEEPSSDGPLVVFERSVRKRKPADDDNAMLPPARKIKSEPSSDPVITNEALIFSPHESIDLDDDGIGMPTPRKQRQTLRGVDDDATPRRDNTSRLLYPRPSVEESSIAQFAAPPDAPGDFPPDRASWTLDNGIAGLAEDGDEDFRSSKARSAAKKSLKQTPGRLQTLLNRVSPEPEPATLRPLRLTNTTPAMRFVEPDTGVAESPSEVGLRNKMSSKGSGSVQTELATPNVRPRLDSVKSSKPTPTRLRHTPLAQLRLQDFKINPKLNDGLTFAYDEVVRNKADRAELEGCTDYNCCGRHYRAMAESEFNAAGAGVLSRPPDVQMMEDYLGPGQSHQLVEMTREERQEVWLKAKSQDMANRLGRHRHRFARKASPPGYWNPDFPDTQEIVENRAEAAKRAKKQIQERWREAMKFGKGKWLFRDE
ncbi:DNA repair protein endonuclease SAE2/CtIP C-terminus-domain-containing protein [Podospora australis]|uniref:DNA repair protein endonuclease SAE2/CtIP C-terminus-domain-containing protein n=1 Tax=Podospora australis TaxID=1536484 RepID=A0AAN6WU41_9PEZI|nr:DNA repair protein endonuclease SAE2/CtIP C-terminus-domain-containing protein [Podospora australis]